MAIPLEDNFTDVIGKAQRGLGLSDSNLAQKSGLAPAQIRELRAGKIDNQALKKIAPILRLDVTALMELAADKWKPDKLENFDGLAQFTTDYGGMAVNAYLVWDLESKHAAAFDTGADCRECCGWRRGKTSPSK